jgi:hypothetical protein
LFSSKTAPQKITYFSRESNLPLSVCLLLDTGRSQTGSLSKNAAPVTFLDQVLRFQKDQACVVRFDTHVETLQGLTSSRGDLSSTLNRLRIPGEFATLIYSAVHQSSENVIRPQPGRKAFILLTDGVAFKDPTSPDPSHQHRNKRHPSPRLRISASSASLR